MRKENMDGKNESRKEGKKKYGVKYGCGDELMKGASPHPLYQE